MKKIFTLLAAAFVMATVVSCGNKVATEGTEAETAANDTITTEEVVAPETETPEVETPETEVVEAEVL